MRRRRSTQLNGMVSIDPVEELNNIFLQASNKKRRKIFNEFTLGDEDGVNSLQKRLGIIMSENVNNYYTPPNIPWTPIVSAPPEDTHKPPTNVDIVWTPPAEEPKRPVIGEEDSGSGLIELEGGSGGNLPAVEGSEQQTKPLPPGVGPEKPHNEEEEEEIIPIEIPLKQEDPTKDSSSSKDEEPSNNYDHNFPNRPALELAPDVPPENEEDVTVIKKIDATGKEVDYAYDPDSKQWIQVKFIEGFKDESSNIFMMNGMLYYYNEDQKSWLFFDPLTEDEHIFYFDAITKSTYNDNDIFVASSPEFGDLFLYPNEEGYVMFNGELYRLDIQANAIIPIGTKADLERQNMLKAIANTYGTEGLYELMYHNFSTYYNAWMELWPNVYPLSVEQYNEQEPKLMALTWMLIAKGPQYLSVFMAEHPDWAIAYSIFNPYTMWDEITKEGSLNKLNLEYQNMTPEQQAEYQRVFEIEWIMSQPKTQEYFQDATKEEMEKYEKIIEQLKEDPNNEQLKEDSTKALMDLYKRVFSVFSNYFEPNAAHWTGLTFEMGISFSVIQIFRIIAYYGFDITLASTQFGLAAQFAREIFNTIALNEGGATTITDLLVDGLTSTSLVRFVAELGSLFIEMGKWAMFRIIVAMGVDAGTALVLLRLAEPLGEAGVELATEGGVAGAAVSSGEVVFEGAAVEGWGASIVAGLESAAAIAGPIVGVIAALLAVYSIGEGIYNYYQAKKEQEYWEDLFKDFQDIYKVFQQNQESLGEGGMDVPDFAQW